MGERPYWPSLDSDHRQSLCKRLISLYYANGLLFILVSSSPYGKATISRHEGQHDGVYLLIASHCVRDGKLVSFCAPFIGHLVYLTVY